ncbi:MAG TPA: DUF3995 domain-containing protein [Phaeodactylibacter sp.]|nr:DUF3995 domain-containing protein [Phaeodactylibacter sp.]
MNAILTLSLCAVFLTLSILHFYWAFGGKWGFAEALPTNEKGERILNPKPIESTVVGFGLLLFAIFYFTKGGWVTIELPEWVWKYVGWMISGIFIFRSIGDFKYVGFFKKIKNTPFGKMDTKYYAPLCLVVGLLGIIVELSAWT